MAFLWKANTPILSSSRLSTCCFSAERKVDALWAPVIRIDNGLLTDEQAHRGQRVTWLTWSRLLVFGSSVSSVSDLQRNRWKTETSAIFFPQSGVTGSILWHYKRPPDGRCHTRSAWQETLFYRAAVGSASKILIRLQLKNVLIVEF